MDSAKRTRHPWGLRWSEVPCQGCITPTMRDFLRCLKNLHLLHHIKFCSEAKARNKKNTSLCQVKFCLLTDLHPAAMGSADLYGHGQQALQNLWPGNGKCERFWFASKEVRQQLPLVGIQLDEKSQARSKMHVCWPREREIATWQSQHEMCLANLLMFRSVPLAYDTSHLSRLWLESLLKVDIRWIIA